MDGVICIADEQVLCLLHRHCQLRFNQFRVWTLTAFDNLPVQIFLRLHVDAEEFENPDRDACSQSKLGISEAERLLSFASLCESKDILWVVLFDEDLIDDLVQVSFDNCRDSKLRLVKIYLLLCNDLSFDQLLTLRPLVFTRHYLLSRLRYRRVD